MPQSHHALFLLLEQRVQPPRLVLRTVRTQDVISPSGAGGRLSTTNTGKKLATASAATLATATAPTFVCSFWWPLS